LHIHDIWRQQGYTKRQNEIAEKSLLKQWFSYSGDAGFVKNPSCPLYQVIITSFFRVVLLFFGPVPRRLTG